MAIASATPTGGVVPLFVNFDATASTDPDGDALTFAWDFGDGSTAAGSTAAHTYLSPGTYNATVTVSDGNGGVDTETLTITVDPPAGGGEDVVVIVTVNSSWNNGFCATVEIVNNGTETINGWTLEFEHPGNINNLWNGNWSNVGGITYRVSDVGWNASIPPGGSRSFGYCSSHGGTIEGPTNGVVNGGSVPIELINGNTGNLTSTNSPNVGRAGSLQVRPTVVDQQVELYYQLTGAGPVRLELINQSGRLVKTVIATTLAEGDHYTRVETETLPAGMYYVRLVAQNGHLIERMIVAH